MAPWCIHISCLERVARSGSGRDSVRGLVGAMDAELSRPDWLPTVQSGRKQVQSRVCTPSFTRCESESAAGDVSADIVTTFSPLYGCNKVGPIHFPRGPTMYGIHYQLIECW